MWLFGTGLALVLTFVGLFYDFSPKIAVSPYQPLELSDAFSSPFMIANDGYLSLRDVSATCILSQVDFTGLALKQGSVGSRIDIAAEMLPGEKLTVKCRFRENIGVASSRTFENADISLLIDYRLRLWFWTFQKQRAFRFVSARASDGSWHWLPQPINK